MKYDRILGGGYSGVYAAPRLVGPLRATAKRAGIRWYDLDLKGVNDREGLLGRFAAAFSFPAHFGHNWDAMHECVRELAGGAAPGAVVHWRRGAELARRAPEAVTTALEILEDAASYWESSGRTLIAVVDRDSARGRALRPLR